MARLVELPYEFGPLSRDVDDLLSHRLQDNICYMACRVDARPRFGGAVTRLDRILADLALIRVWLDAKVAGHPGCWKIP